MFSIRTLALTAIVTIAAMGSTVVPAMAQATGADLQIVKTAPLLPYGTNSIIEYTLEVSNNGPATATIVQVVDPTPAGTTFVSVTVPSGWIFTAPNVGGTGNIVCSTSSLAPEATATIVIQLRIATTTLAGVRITNTATIDGQQPDPFPSTNTSSWQIVVAGSDTDTPGVVDSSTGAWFLRNLNSAGPGDIVFTYGAGGVTQRPLEGDYNNDGTDTPGIYDQTSGAFFLRNSNSNGPADITFSFGAPGATPIAGDWNADGTDSVGIYNSASAAWFLTNTNGVGAAADFVFNYGTSVLSPLTGDWDGR